ncbi:hypothetical protein F5Y16DRAFT_399467 [Xylariaceae sp. FL0255]|nr:hypothetical protein F5Y16DRAFT_399467 [Xylariaceae sp. FL0255]
MTWSNLGIYLAVNPILLELIERVTHEFCDFVFDIAELVVHGLYYFVHGLTNSRNSRPLILALTELGTDSIVHLLVLESTELGRHSLVNVILELSDFGIERLVDFTPDCNDSGIKSLINFVQDASSERRPYEFDGFVESRISEGSHWGTTCEATWS